jgi:hypothetical protein
MSNKTYLALRTAPFPIPVSDRGEALERFLSISRDKLGPWLSAALEDPSVCDEMRADISAWFEALAEIEGGEA